MTDEVRAPLPTERLVLQPVTAELARRIVAGDLSGLQPAAGWPHGDTLDALRAAVATSSEAGWLIQLRETGEIIGDCGAKGPPDATGTTEIGYGLTGPWRGRGYGREAVTALVEWTLAQPNCRRIVAEVHQDNVPSRRLLERLGFSVDRLAGAYVWYALPHSAIRGGLRRGGARPRPGA